MSEATAYKLSAATLRPILNLSDAEFILTLPTVEIKKIKKAVTVLNRAGLTSDEAIKLIVTRYRERKGY